MTRLSMILRLALGGAVRISFVGIFFGALLGIGYGIAVENVSLGLNGAILGGAVTALCGAAYGAFLALTEGPDGPKPKETTSSAARNLLAR